MAARDDSVIRGSLITCMIFLVLSVALNVFLWQWGDTQSTEAGLAQDKLKSITDDNATLLNQATLMKAMLGGVGGLTEAEFKTMSESVGEDESMAAIEDLFVKNMAIFGPEIEPQNRNYPKLPEYLVSSIRDRNEQYANAQQERDRIQVDADNKIAIAEESQKNAEAQAAQANKKLLDATTKFDEDRARINLEKEDTRDKFTKLDKEFNGFRKVALDDKNKLTAKNSQLQGTIDNQKLQLNKLRSDRFEDTQGTVRFVFRHGNVVTINLGSADALRTGVTFGVIDGDETRVQDAKVKATIQVTQIDGAHLAQARVVAEPAIATPIIPGDLIYSPFWAPGRRVKIALAGDIDIDGDNRPDNDAIKGMIKAAGAEVVAEVGASGAKTGKLDASIRFLVVGEDPDLPENADLAQLGADARSIAAVGDIKARATELGLTIIPAWKLQNYLKIMDDSLTTPLGSAVRGEDFPPDRVPGVNKRMPTDLPDLYKRQVEGMQRGNKVLPP